MVQAKVSASISGVKVMTAELTLSGSATMVLLDRRVPVPHSEEGLRVGTRWVLTAFTL